MDNCLCHILTFINVMCKFMCDMLYLICCLFSFICNVSCSVVFRVKSNGRVLGFNGQVMLGSSLHGSQLDIMYVVMSCLDYWLIIFVVRYS